MKRGRTWRNRRKRNSLDKHSVCAPLNTFEQKYIELKKWMKIKSRGLLKKCYLEPRDFPITGRGLKATKPISAGETIVSIPQSLLITPFTALESQVGDIIKKCDPPPTPQAAVSLFLVHENHLGAQSQWRPYIQSLPSEFSTPPYFSSSQLSLLLPDNLRRRAERRIRRLEQVYGEVLSAVRRTTMSSQSEWFSYDRFRWAWSVVNTRCVYLETTATPLFEFTPPGESHLALAPFLDLLNHSCDAKTEAGFNTKTGCYEIKTSNSFKKHDQVFICYGYHDNKKLFLEYGFTIPGNIHNVHTFSWTDICNLKDKFSICYWEKKISVICDNELNQGLTCNASGLSWKLHKVLIILAMTWTELSSWKKLYSNEKISEENEKLVQEMAVWLVECDLSYYHQLKKPYSEENIHERLAASLVQDEIDILEKTLSSIFLK